MQLLKNLPILITGLILGIIIYQSLFIAPSINKILSEEYASKYLRYIWPIFFIIITSLSILSFFLIVFFNSEQNIPKYISAASVILMTICYLSIPYMNEARDSLNDSRFVFLHSLSVILTLITLIINSLIFVFWKF